jgi:predicted nuclease of predicted toxin-antitoxin system
MMLLFDQNLSPKLAKYFDDSFKGSQHLQDLELETSDDFVVWDYAKSNDFTIVTKDSDFNNIVALYGFPPKVIWLRRGNCSTILIKQLIYEQRDIIVDFINDSENGILSIF